MASLKLKRAVNIMLKDFIGLYEGESVLIISDDKRQELGFTLHESSKKICEEVFYLELKSKEHYTYEPPDIIKESMKSVDVVVNASGMNFYDTRALEEVSNLGVRVGLIPNINEESLSRCLGIDHEKITTSSDKMKDILSKATVIRIETRSGTELTIPIKDRDIISSSGVLKRIGDTGYIPSGKVFLAPEHQKMNGFLNIDGSVQGIGLITNPFKLEIENGVIVKVHGDSAESKAFQKILSKTTDDGRIVGEFGIGTNYKATLSGEYYEDEISAGTAYIGIGRNINIGGRIDVPFRLGCVFNRPNIFIDDDLLVHNGKFIGG
jgi:leucyl aminopeptidase (aminopeptidase T)